MVNAGVIPATIVDDNLAGFWTHVFDGIHLHKDIFVNTGGDIAWAFRKNSPKLKKVINGFVQTHREGTLFGNMILQRYLRSADYIKNNAASDEMKKYKSMVGLFKKYGTTYGFEQIELQQVQKEKALQEIDTNTGSRK
jgi:hypothetical protein